MSPRTRSKCFTDAEVRAIRDGRKTQFREVMRPQPVSTELDFGGSVNGEYPMRWFRFDKTTNGRLEFSRIGQHSTAAQRRRAADWLERYHSNGGPKWGRGEVCSLCPYAVGDLIRVRETWSYIGEHVRPAAYLYAADGRNKWLEYYSPATMPAAACRSTLEVIERRCQRLQDITEEDAIAEGADWADCGMDHYGNHIDGWYMLERPADPGYCLGSAVAAFGNAWCRRYGKYKRGVLDTRPWDRNDWVWAITFRKRP